MTQVTGQVASARVRVAAAGSTPTALDADTWARVVAALRFSPQQARIVGLIVRGLQDKQIASELGLAYATVRTYLDRISVRLGVDSRVALVVRVFEAAQRVRDDHGCQQPCCQQKR